MPPTNQSLSTCRSIRGTVTSYLFHPVAFWIAIYVAISAMISAAIVKSGAITTLRCGGKNVVVPYCDVCNGHGAIFYIWDQPWCLSESMYRIARVFPQVGADGKPFVIDMRNKNMTRNWAGEAKVDWRMWEPERPATHEQALMLL